MQLAGCLSAWQVGFHSGYIAQKAGCFFLRFGLASKIVRSTRTHTFCELWYTYMRTHVSAYRVMQEKIDSAGILGFFGGIKSLLPWMINFLTETPIFTR